MVNHNDRDMGYRAKGFPDETFIMQGKSPQEAPYPPELALGNIVRLNEPYKNRWHRIVGYGRCSCGFEFGSGSIPDEYMLHLKETGCKWGIIVEHIRRHWSGTPMVSLYLYDDEGRLLIGPNNIPEYVNFAASEFEVQSKEARDESK